MDAKELATYLKKGDAPVKAAGCATCRAKVMAYLLAVQTAYSDEMEEPLHLRTQEIWQALQFLKQKK